MSAPDDIFVVVNPASGKGRGGRLVQPVLEALAAANGGAKVAHALTARSGDEITITQQAITQGYRRIVAVGGDGTWSHVGNAILRSGKDAALGLVAGGTGCDLAKSLDVPAQDPAAAARVVAAGHTRAIDVGTVENRHFLNVVGFGFDIAVIEDSKEVRWLRGSLLYVYCALRHMHRLPGFPVTMAVDGGPERRREMLMLVFANAKVFGGGFQIAPQADLADGLLEAVAFANMPLRRRLPIMVKLLRGTHGVDQAVESTRGRSFRLRFDSPPAYETDGEWNRARSAELVVQTVPAALRVLVPAA